MDTISANNATQQLRPADQQLDQKLRAALSGRPVKHKVWAFINDLEHTHRAEPILVVVRIVADESGAGLRRRGSGWSSSGSSWPSPSTLWAAGLPPSVRYARAHHAAHELGQGPL